jgi:hypothetical protein
MKDVTMNDLFPNWLDNPGLSHVLACCLRLPNGESHLQLAGPEPANEQFDQVMKRISVIVPLLIEQQLLPGQMLWNFAQGRLHYVVRADGAALGLYCKTGSEAEASAVRDFITDFLQPT